MRELDIRNNISANIAFYRKQKKMTQQELATLLNTKNTTVSTWERGSSLPDAETLFALCRILNVSLSDMYGCDSVDNHFLAISDIERDIVLEYRKSDTITKSMVLRTLSLDSLLSKEHAQNMA